jgi:glycosyltransferase involved in cell wall biosynthesis
MSNEALKVLLIIEQCNPNWSSVPLVGYKFFQEISKFVNTTLVTHERNRENLEKVTEPNDIFYISESAFSKKYHTIASNLAVKGRINWPLYHTLNYPIYAEFNHNVYKKFKTEILRGDYDIVHAITPMMPRYPVKVVKACKNTPFIIGPVNGGVSFPTGFKKIAREEYAYLNFLRNIGRLLIPGYVETYQKANKILAGSSFTLNMLKNLFTLPNNKIELFYENGISKEFMIDKKSVKKEGKLNLLFVGRLVPYKCADILIEAVDKLDKLVQEKIQLVIVGDGSEKEKLEKRVQELSLGEIITFAGWVSQGETLEYYKKADIFCFPSIREFGGAVVLEAMACGLPCIVANNGGIGEYVTEETGFKIEPLSRDYLTQQLTNKIKVLVEDENLREHMSLKSLERVQEFEWEQKARKIVEIYENIQNIL